MSVFVLVHGAFHGRWCFRRLIPSLEAMGHRTIAIDLPSHGDDEADPSSITMEDYVNTVCDVIDSVEHDDPILVGHSMAGMVISEVAERKASRLAGLGYIAAYLPRPGESILAIEARNQAPKMAAAITPAPDMSHALIDREMASPLFYHDCPEADVRFATERLATQPGEPFLSPVTLSDAGFGSVEKGYIMCEDDQVIPLALQQDMLAKYEGTHVYSLPSGHSPFFSQVDALAESLSSFSRDVLVKTGRAAA